MNYTTSGRLCGFDKSEPGCIADGTRPARHIQAVDWSSLSVHVSVSPHSCLPLHSQHLWLIVFCNGCRIEFLRNIREFFQVMFNVEAHKSEEQDTLSLGDGKLLLTCMGIGYTNLNKVILWTFISLTLTDLIFTFYSCCFLIAISIHGWAWLMHHSARYGMAVVLFMCSTNAVWIWSGLNNCNSICTCMVLDYLLIEIFSQTFTMAYTYILLNESKESINYAWKVCWWPGFMSLWRWWSPLVYILIYSGIMFCIWGVWCGIGWILANRSTRHLDEIIIDMESWHCQYRYHCTYGFSKWFSGYKRIKYRSV